MYMCSRNTFVCQGGQVVFHSCFPSLLPILQSCTKLQALFEIRVCAFHKLIFLRPSTDCLCFFVCAHTSAHLHREWRPVPQIRCRIGKSSQMIAPKKMYDLTFLQKAGTSTDCTGFRGSAFSTFLVGVDSQSCSRSRQSSRQDQHETQSA